MANLDLPCGFVPFGPVLRQTKYLAGGTIYPGDCLKFKNDGTVEVAAASNALMGVALSYATSGLAVMVADEPAQRFIGQSDDATLVALDVGLGINLLATAGSSTYRQSRHEIDGDSGDASTATLPLKILAIVDQPGNAVGANADYVVVINNHQLGGGTGVAGV